MLKKFLLAALCVALMRTATAQAAPRETEGSPATFRNPLKIKGADPWMTFYNGYYYLTTTSSTDVRMRHARRIGDLLDAPDTVVWKDDTPGRAVALWASEFHLLDDGNGPRWYLYYTAASPGNDNSHRLFVAQSTGTDPEGPYSFKAQLKTDERNQQYAIDGTVFQLPNGDLYQVWCGRPSPTGQGLYIAKMSNPWTISGPRTYLDASGFGCPDVREGPEILQHDGKICLVYSMCNASTPDYRLGMLVADGQSDLLDPKSWQQHPKLLFARVDQRGVYGPGHCFFFKSPDGTQDWIVYHAKTTSNVTFGDRTTRAQKFTWSAAGVPEFGLPLSTDVDIAVPAGESQSATLPLTPAKRAPRRWRLRTPRASQ